MKILIAEDDPVSRCLLEELLAGWGHEVLIAEDGATALAMVSESQGFDVAILDWMMPGVAGVDVCKRIRDASEERHPHVLMLTAKARLEDVVSGLDAGADDYLTKPYRPAELAARLRAAERFLRVQDDLIGARRLVVYQAEHDILTGTLNRAALLTRLHALCVERRKRPVAISVLRVDVAGFARINEKHGIGVGDDVLRGLVDRVRVAVPSGAPVGRNGPDELLVVLADADAETANRIGAAVTESVRALPFVTQVGPVRVVADVGVVTARAPAELDLGWILSALDAVEKSAGSRPRSGERTRTSASA